MSVPAITVLVVLVVVRKPLARRLTEFLTSDRPAEDPRVAAAGGAVTGAATVVAAAITLGSLRK
jgi:hypothetical protein